MKTLKYLFLLLAFATLGLTSCTKEDTVVDDTENPTTVTPETGVSNPLMDNISTRSDGSLDLGCFTIDFPFSLDVDGEVVEIADEEDFVALLETLTEESLVDFVYPLSITYEDGSNESIGSGEELGAAFVSCIPDDGWGVDSLYPGANLFPAFLFDTDDLCIGLVYPVSLVDADGNSTQVDSEADLIEILAEATEVLYFDFPLTVEDEDGEQIVVQDGDALFELFISCDQINTGGGFDTTFTFGGEIGCYGVEYPFSVVMADGSVVEVLDHDQFCALMLEGNLAGFAYPITLVTAEGETLVVNSDAELGDALEDCWDIGGPIFDPGFYILVEGSLAAGHDCYSVNYPITAIILDAEVEVGSYEEAIALIGNGTDFIELKYPVSITLLATSEEVTIASFEDLIVLDCQ